MDKLTA